MKESIKKAHDLALKEIKLFGLPSKENLEISNDKGQELAKILGADKEIVALGTRLMDIKLGEAAKLNKIQDHVNMGVLRTEEFLKTLNLSEEKKKNLVCCVKEHHGSKKFYSLESEICANADCYRFLDTKHWLLFLSSLINKGMSFEDALDFATKKLEEKWSILSLKECIQELTPHYKAIKQIIKLSN